MRQKLFGIVVLLCVLLSIGGGFVLAQDAKGGPTLESAVKLADETEALKKKNAQLQAALDKATAEQRKEEARKAIAGVAANLKKELGPVCAANGAKWAFMQANINGTPTTLIGCVAN